MCLLQPPAPPKKRKSHSVTFPFTQEKKVTRVSRGSHTAAPQLDPSPCAEAVNQWTLVEDDARQPGRRQTQECCVSNANSEHRQLHHFPGECVAGFGKSGWDTVRCVRNSRTEFLAQSSGGAAKTNAPGGSAPPLCLGWQRLLWMYLRREELRGGGGGGWMDEEEKKHSKDDRWWFSRSRVGPSAVKGIAAGKKTRSGKKKGRGNNELTWMPLHWFYFNKLEQQHLQSLTRSQVTQTPLCFLSVAQ